MVNTGSISHLLARRVIETLAPRINVPMNVMDASGVIIASSDAGRIGTVHNDALRALAENRTVTTYESDASGKKPGVNVPLYLAGRLQAVVGLTGEPEKVAPLAQLVCLTIELLVNQHKEFSASTALATQRTELLAALASLSIDAEELEERLQQTKLPAPWKLSVYFAPEQHDELGGTTLRMGQLLWVLCERQEGWERPWGIARWPRYTARELLVDAQDLRALSQYPVLVPKFDNDLWDMSLAVQCAKASFDACVLMAQRVEALTHEHAQTLLVLMRSASQAEAIEQRAVHRNTLIQRMDRIRQLTGVDPKTPRGVATLVNALYAAVRTGKMHIF